MIDSSTYSFNIGTKRNRGKILPVFLPFAGCPFKCLYCAQDTQTGAGQIPVSEALLELEKNIAIIGKKQASQNIPSKITSNTLDISKKSKNPSLEIAFYGGTFTALSDADFKACLQTFTRVKTLLTSQGFQVFGRCSTRPDCLEDTKRLLAMKESGIDLIELGIQSFHEDVLIGLGRGYTKELAKKACARVKELGFLLGIQLMPSSPQSRNISENLLAQNPEIFYQDVRTALSFSPACLRYYPCLVLKNTPLASLWEKGNFIPWDLSMTVETLGYALFLAWQKQVPVIRLSVAFEENFEKNVLAGVRHPSLGCLIQARALRFAFLFARQAIKDTSNKEILSKDKSNKDTLNKDTLKNICLITNKTTQKLKNIQITTQNAILKKNTLEEYELYLPLACQGFIFGEKNALKKEWEKDIPLKNIFFIRN